MAGGGKVVAAVAEASLQLCSGGTTVAAPTVVTCPWTQRRRAGGSPPVGHTSLRQRCDAGGGTSGGGTAVDPTPADSHRACVVKPLMTRRQGTGGNTTVAFTSLHQRCDAGGGTGCGGLPTTHCGIWTTVAKHT